MRGLYGKVLPGVFRTDRATKEQNRRQYFPVQTEQVRLIRDLLYRFVELQFVPDFVEKTRKHFFVAVFVVVLFGVIFALKRSICGSFVSPG